ncbi:uncharacterized protein LOC116429121 isoform X2 [Nomia melanderi]|uniref:uncharacterized protein LOC116429121 isoform X2 n=1 Tax=Nomia melanderi TaxID=2448451 RepID=UPI003FCD39AB
MIDRTIVVVLLGLLGLGYGLQCPKQKTSPGREVVCYTSVSDVGKLTNALCRCTTLVHQGYDVRNLSTSDFEDFRNSLKKINPPLQFMISVEDHAKTLRTSGTVRQETIARLLGILKDIDGVQLNMTAGTKERLLDFVKGLKDELVRKSQDKRIFVVLSTKGEDLAKQFDLKELTKYVDLFTLPTHYLAEDDDDSHTFHPSRLMGLFDLYNADSLIDLISGLGAPKRKILVSVPATAYKFILKDEDGNAPGSPTEEKQPIIIDRKQLCNSLNNGEWTVERDEDLTAPYAFKNKTWIAFEDKISIAIKGKYALLRELPGLAIYDIENDFETQCGKPLTHEIHHSFTDFKRKSRAAVLNALEDDLHQTQLTYPTKVKSSEYRVVRVVDTEGHIRAVRENTQTEFTCPRQGYFVHPKSCNRFYRCVKFNQEVEDYSVFEFDCPAGLAFDERTEVCVWPGSLPQGSPCPGSSEIAPVTRVRFECPSTPGYYADPQNPRWFFACMDLGGPEMMAFEFRCPFGLIFDEHKLVCEWPWLVPGYSEGGYSTQSGDGYFTGGLSHGYTSQGGIYTGTTAGIDYSGSTGGYSGYSGFSGAAGVGHAGSTVGGHGSSFGQGSVGYTGTTGSGYTGSGGAQIGTGYSTGGYGGSTGKGGSVSGSYGGQSGTGYSKPGTDYSGSNGVYTGHTGSGLEYTGATGQASIGSSYAGKGTTVHSGAGGIYSGATGQASIGSGYGGKGTTVHSGAGGIYSAATGGSGHFGQSGYSGTTSNIHGGAGYIGSTGKVGGGIDYSGSTIGVHGGSGYSGATGNVGGGNDYSGSTDKVGGGIDYSGATTGVHGGCDYSGSTGKVGGGSGCSGSTGNVGGGSGYSGATGGVHGGSGYQVSTGNVGVHGGSGYQGSTGNVGGTGYSGTTDSVHGGSGYQGSTGNVGGTGYSGTTGGVHGGSGYQGSTGNVGGTGYSGATGGVRGGSGYQGSTGSDYSGSTGNVEGGSGYSGSTVGVHGGSGYQGSTGNVGGSGYSGTTSNVGGGSGYSGSTVGVHGGSDYSGSTGNVEGGSGYSGSTVGVHGASGYSGSTVGVHAGSDYSGSTGNVEGGSGYSGSTVGVHGGSDYSGSTGNVGGSGYSGSTIIVGGSDGTGYEGANAGGYKGSTGGGYTGPTTSAHAGSIGGGFTVPVDRGYTGSTSDAHAGVGYVGTTVGGYQGSTSGSHVGFSGSSSSGYTPGGYTPGIKTGTGVSGVQYTGSHLGGSQTGTSTGQTIIYGIQHPQTEIYRLSGTTDTGTTYVQKPEKPGVNCVSTCVTSQQPVEQTYSTGGYISGHEGSGGIFPGQKGVTSTYFGSTGAQGYDQGVVTSGTTVYQGSNGYTGGYQGIGGKDNLNITFVGGQVPSSSTTYHGIGKPSIGYGGTGSTGTIATGNSVPGSIITGNSSPGTLFTYGETPGTVISGYSDQGTVVTGDSQPGYIKTGSGTPGYVINKGVKTIYTGSGSPGTAVYGTSAPGVVLTGAPDSGTVLKGQSSPGIVLTGQTAPGVSIHGASDQGTVIGSTGHQLFTDSGYSQPGVTAGPGYGTKIGVGSTTQNTGYKINEYHDNGGRGTIKFNNGDVTTKYTENDIPDYRPGGGNILPDTLLPGYNAGSQTSSGFTKTGPTKTGITTATLGGRGSYVISTGQTRPTIKPDSIGEKAFEGNVAGFTKTSTEGSVNLYQGSTQSQNVNYVDTSKITLGPAKPTGYTYPKPSIAFETGIKSTTEVPDFSTPSGVLTGTTPTPFLNVEVYNSPKLVGPTASPGVVKIDSTQGYYQGKVPTGFISGPTPTITTTGYAGSLDDYKTTAFNSVKVPGVSTARPVIDTVYKISTPVSAPEGQDKFGGNVQTGSVSTQFNYETKTSQEDGYGQQNGFISSTTQPSVFGVTSTYTISKPRPFGPGISVTQQPEINYVSSTSSGSEYFDSKSSFGQRVTSSGISGSLKPQTQYLPSDSPGPVIKLTPLPDITYQQSTPIVPVTLTGQSPTNVEISRNEVGKLVTNYNRGTTKYVPSQYDIYTPGVLTGGDYPKSQTSLYGSTPAPFGRTQFSSGFSSTSSGISYETTAKTTAVGKAKVIVKWSDLHPLLLGKLGAECTCKGDPFANLRGPGSKLINSSKGKVDLSNYDESDIYVDLDKDNGSYEDNDYTSNYDSTSARPFKLWPIETPAPVSSSEDSQISQKPSSAYLPSVTSSAGLHGSVPPTPAVSQGFTANYRSGKSLNDDGSTANSVGKGASFDRYGPGGLRDSEEVLEGATNCARPGLFRHPNFCNKFYACHWDEWKKKFTLHVFNCPVHLTFDNGAGACNWPSMGPACQDDNLLV